jgi:calcium permeable stress-gated cation channel
MNGVLFVAFVLFYVLYKYLFLWVMEQPMSSDTGGLFFPKAIHHIFVGLYVEQVCLAALFILARNEKGKPSALAEGAFMIVLIVLTVSSVDDDEGQLKVTV